MLRGKHGYFSWLFFVAIFPTIRANLHCAAAFCDLTPPYY